ncbi:MAG: GNAT family N-acetyltransferase [Desulfobacterales bacterium]|nr:GNAT family N-acetyltransferase [Desulfobacterales bacterium]
MSEKEITDLRAFWENAVPGDYQHFLSRYGFPLHFKEPEAGGIRKIVAAKGDIFATGRIVPLDWDSEFFGFSCARLEGLFFSGEGDPIYARERLMAALLEEEVARTAVFLSCRVRADDLPLAQALEAAGFRLVDVMAVFMKKLDGLAHSRRHGIALKYEASNIIPLLEECIRGMRFGRMLADPNIPKEKAHEFYLQVSRYYLTQGAAAVVLQYDGANVGLAIGVPDETISGYLKRRYGYLWFIGLLSDFKGKRLGHELFSLFCREFACSCDILEIGTQVHNYPATRVYEKGACAVSNHLLTFHRWNKKTTHPPC